MDLLKLLEPLLDIVGGGDFWTVFNWYRCKASVMASRVTPGAGPERSLV